MNWLSNLTPPGIKNIFNKPDDSADTLWVKCGGCGEMIFQRDLEANTYVCPSCNHHMQISHTERLEMLFDDGNYERIAMPECPTDPLKFKDTKKYADRLRDHRRRTGEQDAIIAATGTIDNMPAVIGIQNFAFMGGSMGMAVGEGFLTAANRAIDLHAPLIMFTASGGARMQESILALMQMPRTTIAVDLLREAKLPFIVVLTNPTTGGVMASFAMLGDVHIAEPGAVIGFAGRRVIEQTIREQLPDEFQKSEFLLDKGMVDLVVHRHELRETLSRLNRVLLSPEKATTVEIAPTPEAEQEAPSKAATAEAPPTPVAEEATVKLIKKPEQKKSLTDKALGAKKKKSSTPANDADAPKEQSTALDKAAE